MSYLEGPVIQHEEVVGLPVPMDHPVAHQPAQHAHLRVAQGAAEGRRGLVPDCKGTHKTAHTARQLEFRVF